MKEPNKSNVIKTIGGYKIVKWFANAVYGDGEVPYYGDIYQTEAQAEAEHPGDRILIGYGVIDSAGCIPDNAADWYDTVEEAEEYIKENLEN